MNGSLDLERRVTDWLRAEAPSRAPARILDGALDRVAVVGQERALTIRRYSDRSGLSRLGLVAATAALLVALAAAAMFVGSQIQGEDVPLSVPVAPPAFPFVPTAPPVPEARPPTQIGSGSAPTGIGQIAWTAVEGDATNIPSGEIFATPNGFAAVETDLDRRGSRFWQSPDGLSWSVTPMPVPAAGAVGHGVAAGEHWVWSSSEFRLWRSADFVSWTEVDIEALRPPAIDGVDWGLYAGRPVTAGASTVLPWTVSGNLALEVAFGISPIAGTSLMIGGSRDDPALGDVRDVWRVRTTLIGPDTEGRVKVGSIRIELEGTVVTVTDAERGVVMAEIDTDVIGGEPATVADDLNRYGFIRGPGQGVVVADGTARRLETPMEMDYVDAVDGRFIAMSGLYSGPVRETWASTDGIEWTSLGPPVGPVAAPLVSLFEVLPNPDGVTDEPMTAVVMIDEAGTQRTEMWSSTDGVDWDRIALTFTHPETGFRPFRVPSGGYLATGDDYRMRVSATGDDWTTVEGLDDVGQRMEEGGTGMVSKTDHTIFYADLPLSGDRVLWVLRIDPAG